MSEGNATWDMRGATGGDGTFASERLRTAPISPAQPMAATGSEEQRESGVVKQSETVLFFWHAAGCRRGGGGEVFHRFSFVLV